MATPSRTSRWTSFSRTSSGRSQTRSPSPTPWSATRRRGCLGRAPDAAVVRYDLLFLFAYALAFAGAYLLARELGLGWGGAAVAGAAFAFAPFRLEQDGHMQVISSGGIPLAFAARPAGLPPPPAGVGGRGMGGRRLAAVGRFHARPAARLPAGDHLGDCSDRLGPQGVDHASAGVWRSRRSAGAAIFVAAGLLLSRPYVRVADAYRGRSNARGGGGVLGAAVDPFVAPDENLVWGGATSPLRDGLGNVPEKTLFPGLVIVVLAVAGAFRSAYRRWLRRGLGVGVVAILVLALGFRESGGLVWPYRVCMSWCRDGMRSGFRAGW